MNIQCPNAREPHTARHPHALSAQSGAALTIALVVLVVMTVLGLASMRGTTMQEKMADAFDMHQVASQSADGGVNAAESELHAVFLAACLEEDSPMSTCLNDQTMHMKGFDACFSDSSDCTDGLCATSDRKDWASWNLGIWTDTSKHRNLSSVADLTGVEWGVSPIAGIEPRFLVRALGRLPCDPSQPEALRTGSREDDKRMISATQGLGGFDLLSYYYELVSRYGDFGNTGQNISDAIVKSTYTIPDLR